MIGAKPKGLDAEWAVFELTILADHLYLIDGGYAKFPLWNMIVEPASRYVCRVCDNSQYYVLELADVSDTGNVKLSVSLTCIPFHSHASSADDSILAATSQVSSHSAGSESLAQARQ